MSGARLVQIAFAWTAFCGALGMSVSPKRAETEWRLSVVNGIVSGCDNEALEQELSISTHWRLRLKCRHLVTAFERVLRHWNARHRVHNLLSDFFRAAHINVTSRIDSRLDVPQRCVLSKRISFKHCEKQVVSVFHVAALPRFTCILVLFIGAVLGSTQFLHCSIYLSACRHST